MTCAFVPCRPHVRQAAPRLPCQTVSAPQAEHRFFVCGFAPHAAQRFISFVRRAFFCSGSRHTGQLFGDRRSFDSAVRRFCGICLGPSSSSRTTDIVRFVTSALRGNVRPEAPLSSKQKRAGTRSVCAYVGLYAARPVPRAEAGAARRLPPRSCEATTGELVG